jgi:hypothetical protein
MGAGVRVIAICPPLDDPSFAGWHFLAPPFTTPALQAALREAAGG